LLPPSWLQTFSSLPCSHTHSINKYLLGYTMRFGSLPTFQRNIRPWSSGLNGQSTKQGARTNLIPSIMFFPEVLNKWLILISLLIDLLIVQGTYFPAHLNANFLLDHVTPK
jgi:hypothetical protein